MVARKTKRVAVVTAVSASLMIGGAAAFAHDVPDDICPRGNGKGLGHGHPGGDKGNGLDKGWPHKKCDKQDNNAGGSNPGGSNPGGANTGGGSTGGGSTGGGSTGGGTTGDDHDVDANVKIEVDLPHLPLPDPATVAGDVVDHAQTIADHTVTLAESDVEALMEIVDGAGDGATSLAGGTAQAGVSVNGTSGTGTVNVSSGAVGGATTLGTNLAGSALDFVNGNATGARHILGAVLSII